MAMAVNGVKRRNLFHEKCWKLDGKDLSQRMAGSWRTIASVSRKIPASSSGRRSYLYKVWTCWKCKAKIIKLCWMMPTFLLKESLYCGSFGTVLLFNFERKGGGPFPHSRTKQKLWNWPGERASLWHRAWKRWSNLRGQVGMTHQQNITWSTAY